MQDLTCDHPADVVDLDIPWDVRRPRDAEAALRRLLAELGSTSESDLVRSIEIRTQIARAEGIQGKVREADKTLLDAEKAVASVAALSPRLRILLERGRLLVVAKTPAQARERFLEVWQLAKDSPEDACHAVDAAQMMSKIETPKKRNEWTLRALEIAERSQDGRVKSWRGVLYVSLGWHCLELLQLPRALEAFEKAAICFGELRATLYRIRARSYVGRTLRIMGRIDEALALQKDLLDELDREGARDGTVNEELGECLYALKRKSEAEAHFARAFNLLSGDQELANQEPSRLKRLKTLGNVKAER